MSNSSDLVTTSFQLDYRVLVLLQKRANELGFRSWGACLRHVVDYHVVLVEPDLLRELPRGPSRTESSG
jgi:hypothetical protein